MPQGLAIGAWLLTGAAQAAVIGRTVPPAALTVARLAEAPDGQRRAWANYLERSRAAHRLDTETLASERRAGPAPDPPVAGDAAVSMPLDLPTAWYGGAEARRVGDVIVSFQTPAGGWGKNEPRTGPERRPGQAFTGNAGYVGTLDNGATVTELRFLARVIGATPAAGSVPYRESFRRGVRYLLAAQMPNGGWPQVWPLSGGYHDAVTFNDGAMVAATRLLGEVAAETGDYGFVAAGLRGEARAAWRRAVDCLIAAQVVVDGRPAGWGQQSDAMTLRAVAGRNFEPRSLASAESAELLIYLMSLAEPSPAVQRAVHGGTAWLARAALADKAWTDAGAEGRRLVDRPGAPPLWARFYDIETGRPIFGDRDLTIHDDVHDRTPERRNGYAWFDTAPAKALARYAAWAKAHPAP